MSIKKNSEFALFIDESGSPKPNLKDSTPYFALGGVLVKRADEKAIESAVRSLKRRWNINEDTALHASEIRSQKRHFAWLGKLSQEVWKARRKATPFYNLQIYAFIQ